MRGLLARASRWALDDMDVACVLDTTFSQIIALNYFEMS